MMLAGMSFDFAESLSRIEGRVYPLMVAARGKRMPSSNYAWPNKKARDSGASIQKYSQIVCEYLLHKTRAALK